MDFSQRKLSLDASEYLRTAEIRSVKPFALLMAPAYVYMKLNQKYVMVKRPLDFFTEDELVRLSSFESLFFPKENETSLLFKRAAGEVKALLQWCPQETSSEADAVLPPASYEVSDAVIRLIAPLWEAGLKIDPFYVALFVNELCYPFPPEVLEACRERDVVLYERAALDSSWVVFLALHLGYADLDFLSQLRMKVMQGDSQEKGSSASVEVNELIHLAQGSLEHAGAQDSAFPGQLIGAQLLLENRGRASQKLLARFHRVEALSHV